MVSGLVHLVVLLGLGLMFVARESKPEPMAIEFAAATEDPSIDDAAAVEFESPESDADDSALALDSMVEPLEVSPEPEAVVPVDAPAVVDAGEPVDFGDLPAAGADLLADLGAGQQGGGGGGSAGSRGGGTAAGPTFFGTTGQGKTAVFLCDNSASYADGGFQMVLMELAHAVAALKPDQSFHVVFFSDAAYPLFHPQRVEEFLPATDDNKRRLEQWLGTVELCIGGQGLREAMNLAVRLEPDVVYFLSDGKHEETVVDRLVAAPLTNTVVHTFGMQADIRDRRTGRPDPVKVAKQQEANGKLARIAEAHGGRFTPVTVPPQAAMADRMRPLKVNRLRGAVWGTALPAP